MSQQNEISVDFRSLLAEETEWVVGEELHVGREPAGPSNVITIYDLPGAGPLPEYERGDEKYMYASAQIRVRHTSYLTAFSWAHRTVEILDGIGNQEINETFYTLIRALDSPSILTWDDNNRAIVVVNFAIQRITVKQTTET